MARNPEVATGWLNRQVPIRAWWVAAAAIILPLAFLFASVATDDDAIVALSGHQVSSDGASGRIWHGTMLNTTPKNSPLLFREVAVTIRFLDRDGMPVGEVSGGVDRLEAGQGIDLEAALPPEAETMQVYSLQWRMAHIARLLGPWPAWQFGFVQHR